MGAIFVYGMWEKNENKQKKWPGLAHLKNISESLFNFVHNQNK